MINYALCKSTLECYRMHQNATSTRLTSSHFIQRILGYPNLSGSSGVTWKVSSCSRLLLVHSTKCTTDRIWEGTRTWSFHSVFCILNGRSASKTKQEFYNLKYILPQSWSKNETSFTDFGHKKLCSVAMSSCIAAGCPPPCNTITVNVSLKVKHGHGDKNDQKCVRKSWNALWWIFIHLHSSCGVYSNGTELHDMSKIDLRFPLVLCHARLQKRSIMSV